MYIMNTKPILNGSEPPSQYDIQTSRPDNGLRILAKIIARDLLSKRSIHTSNKDVDAHDPQVSVDS